VDLEGLFRRRLKQLIRRKYRSLDRFYLETDFSKGHLSEILRGKGSPTVSTLTKLAKALDVEVNELFVFPERGLRDRAIELVHVAKPELVRRVIQLLTEEANKSQ
jgi:transcriptional regulator with XRE-family HTH domain